MEKLKVKHDHKLTDILKICIFSLFLILPILMFLPNALYYGFNEHAINDIDTQVDIQYKYQSNEVNDLNDLVYDNIYILDDFELKLGNTVMEDFSINIYVFDSCFYEGDFVLDDFDISNYDNNNSYIKVDMVVDYGIYFTFPTSGDFYSTILFESPITFNFTNLIFSINNSYDIIYFKDYCLEYYYLPQYTDYNVIESVDVQTDVEQSISEKMYIGWKGIWQTPLFAWTGTSNFETTINAFVNVFGISNNSYIPNYLCYIFTLIVIYIIYDIVIVLFTKLTHLFTE